MDSSVILEQPQLENPFTEIFQILSNPLFMPNQHLSPTNSDNLFAIYQHAENATDLLLSGLQDLSYLMGIAKQLNHDSYSNLYHLEFLIAAISNLLIALGTLKSNADYIIKQREIAPNT